MIFFQSASFQYLASASAETLPSSGTVMLWVLTNALLGTGESMLFQAANSRLTTNVTPKIRCRIGRTAFITSNITLSSANVLYHIAATYNSANGDNSIYVNGVLDIANITGTGSALANNTIYIGSNNGATEWADGYYEDYRIYNRILTADEILSIYTSRGADRIYNGLIHRWLMREVPGGAVGTVYDWVNTANNLSPVVAQTYSDSILKLHRPNIRRFVSG